jgi:hypothetical protein
MARTENRSIGHRRPGRSDDDWVPRQTQYTGHNARSCRVPRGSPYAAGLSACSSNAGSSAAGRLTAVRRDLAVLYLSDLDHVTIRVPDVRPDFAAAVPGLSEELRALHRPLRAGRADVRDLTLRNALACPGSAGAASVTVALSSVGPPPTLRMSQLLAIFMITGSRPAPPSPRRLTGRTHGTGPGRRPPGRE